MSWLEKIKENIQITTGDGKVYTPLYFMSSRKIEFNISKFDFPDINGTLVKRTTVMGGTFPMEIIFQGEDHLDIRDEFERSSIDNRPWTILHPVYGSKLVHPSTLTFDSTGLNTTVVSGEFHETIVDEFPQATKNPIIEVEILAEQANTANIDAFVNTVVVDSSVTASLEKSTNDSYQLGASAIKSGEQSNGYFNAWKEASNAISFGIANASNMALKVSAFTNSPYLFDSAISARLSLFRSQFEKLSLAIGTLTDPKQKKTYEFSSVAIIAAMFNCSIKPIAGDYTNSNSVFLVINQLIDTYNLLIENLDSLQTENAGSVNGYVPSFESLSGLGNLVNYTISNLYQIALNAKQERKLILEADSNVIVLTHRFYGLDSSDQNIEMFMNTNSIGMNEYFEIKKGRIITYYV